MPEQIMNKASGLFGAAALSATLAATSAFGVNVTLDFGNPGIQIEALSGASICNFGWEGEDEAGTGKTPFYGAGGALDGQPTSVTANAEGSGSWSKYMNTAFGTIDTDDNSLRFEKGMAIHNTWWTANPRMMDQSSDLVGGINADSYSDINWGNLEFDYLNSASINTSNYFWGKGTKNGKYEYAGSNKPNRFTTGSMLRAAVKLSRRDKNRMLIWFDQHHNYPNWMWSDQTDNNQKVANYKATTLFLIANIKYVVSRMGIPIHLVSVANEPNFPNRHQSGTDYADFQTWVSEARTLFDEAGLHGVRLMPAAWGHGGRGSMLNQLANPDDAADVVSWHYAPYNGYTTTSHATTKKWISSCLSGDCGKQRVETYKGDDRMRRWMMAFHNGYTLGSNWQLAAIAGEWSEMRDASTGARTSWDPYTAKDGNGNATDHNPDFRATVLPYVRPGMSVVGGSETSATETSATAVYGFTGRGHRDVIVITNNDASTNSFTITVNNTDATQFEIFQMSQYSGKNRIGTVNKSSGKVTVNNVPKNSVTTLVATQGSSNDGRTENPRAYLIVGNAGSMTTDDNRIKANLEAEGCEVKVLNQSLTSSEKTTYGEKRHPIDAMGAAMYVLSSSVSSEATVMAHRYVMAPVIAVGTGTARNNLGLSSQHAVSAGSSLDSRHSTENALNSAGLLDGGKPKATGRRESRSSVGSNNDSGLRSAISAALAETDLGGTAGGGGSCNAPSISSQPSSTTKTEGQTATFSVSASGDATLTYQWKKNNSNISGATSSSYTTPTLSTSDDGNTYKVTVTNSCGNVTSSTATLTVNASGGGGGGDVTLDAYDATTSSTTKRTDNGGWTGSGWADINSGGSISWTFSGTTGTYDIKVRLSDWGSSTRTVGVFVGSTKVGTATATAAIPSWNEVTISGVSISNGQTIKLDDTEGADEPNVDKVTLVSAGGGSCTAPSITSHPSNASKTSGQTATFSASASGDATLSYQWKKNNSNISGATSSSYTTPSLSTSDDGNTYKVTVTNSCGSATSNSATLTVSSSCTSPSISSHPSNSTKNVGQTATFSVSASGTSLSYQWKKNGSNISGATSSSYTTPTLASGDDGNTYSVYVSNSCGNVTSNSATLTVNASGGGGTTRLEAESATLTNTGTGTGRGSTGSGFADVNDNGIVSFTYNAASAGTYTIDMRMAAIWSSPRGLELFVNGTSQGVFSTTALDPNWDMKTKSCSFNSGNNTIELRATPSYSNEANLDYIEITAP